MSKFVDAADHGAVADGGSHPLSSKYGTIEEAKAVYPFAVSLTQQLDYCAAKKAANLAFGSDGGEHGTAAHNNKRLHLSAGRYNFGNDTLLIRNLAGAIIEGDGENVTVLTGNKTLLAFDGIWYTRISDMSVLCQTSAATAAMELDGNISGHPYATRGVQAVTLSDMLIDGGLSSYALAMNRRGGSGGQGSECNFRKLHLSRGSEACYFQNGFNALANTFSGGNCQSYPKHGLYVLGGTISVHEMGFQSTYGYAQYENDGWDIVVGEAGAGGEPCIISGCRTESIRFLKNAGAVRTVVSGVQGRIALATWFANTPYGPGAPLGKAIFASGRVFVATTPGTSGAQQPTWPINGSTVQDGTIVWKETLFNAIEIQYGGGSVDCNTVAVQAGRIYAQPAFHVVQVSADYSVRNDIDTVVADATNGSIRITLPMNAGNRGRRVTIKKCDLSANTIVVDASAVGFEHTTGTDTIPGGSRGFRTYVLSDGTAGVLRWHIVGVGVGTGA